MNPREIEVPVPWGIISAKTRGSSMNPLVLLFHGLEDNANTFDYLICKLPQEYYYVSVDLPGHGRSNFLPSLGLPLQAMDYVYTIKLLTDHFERDKYIIIGHSFGGILGMQYGLVYPEKVDKIFIIDTLWFQIVQPSEFGRWTRKKFDEFGKISQQFQKSTNTEFTYEQCYDLISGWGWRSGELTQKSTETLLQRSIKSCGADKYKFTRDPKLKNYMCYPVDERYACDVLRSHNINFKVVVIISTDYQKYYLENYPNLMETYKQIGDWITVDGNHYVHLNNPGVVADIMNNYLEECVAI